MEYIDRIFYRKINPSDFKKLYDIDRPEGGGGQTYLEAAGIPNDDIVDFLGYAEVSDSPLQNEHRSIYTFNAYPVLRRIMKMIDLEIVTRCANCAECDEMEDQLYCGKSGCFVKPDHFCGDGHSVFSGGEGVNEDDIINAVRRKYNIRCGRCKLADEDSRGARWCRMHKIPVTHFFMCLDFDPRTEEDDEWT